MNLVRLDSAEDAERLPMDDCLPGRDPAKVLDKLPRTNAVKPKELRIATRLIDSMSGPGARSSPRPNRQGRPG